jgi:alpha-tubulin suppressor-like RCC1 family protein
VFTWGFGNEGQLGHGDKSDQFQPRKIANLKSKVKAISCGGAHTALLTEAGKLLMVGRGREGQLGREQKDESNSGYTLLAKEVEQLPTAPIMKVRCGASHTLVLLDGLI